MISVEWYRRGCFSAEVQCAKLIAHDPRLPPAVWGKLRGMRRLAEAFTDFEQRVAKPAAAFLEEVIFGSPATTLRRKV